MATNAPTLTGSAAPSSFFNWFGQFLKSELAPYPGRGVTVARMVIAATLTMILIMTFKIPGGALGVTYALLISRDSLYATLQSASTIVVSYTAGPRVFDPRRSPVCGCADGPFPVARRQLDRRLLRAADSAKFRRGYRLRLPGGKRASHLAVARNSRSAPRNNAVVDSLGRLGNSRHGYHGNHFSRLPREKTNCLKVWITD